MPTISRHAGAPWVDGQTLTAADLESDVGSLFALVNGGLDGSNIATEGVTAGAIGSSAVTTAKIADSAVTTAKIEDGAASESEVDKTATSQVVNSTTYATVGATVSHAVSATPRHVVITCSMRVVIVSSPKQVMFKLQRDGADMASNPEEAVDCPVGNTIVTRVWIDDAPTASATHDYSIQAKMTSGGTQMTLANVNTLVFEPRR